MVVSQAPCGWVAQPFQEVASCLFSAFLFDSTIFRAVGEQERGAGEADWAVQEGGWSSSQKSSPRCSV